MLRAALVATAACAGALAADGLDVSMFVSASAAKCLASSHSFGVVRAWRSFGGMDYNAHASASNMWAAGFGSVGVYMFPCRSKDAGAQVRSMISGLASNGTKYDRIWLDIEDNPSTGCGWTSTTEANGLYNATGAAENCAYVDALVKAVEGAGKKAGIYASKYYWSKIVGSTCKSGAGLPVWYAHYDGLKTYNDWADFGPWTKANVFAKQFSSTGNTCGVSYDENWHP